MTCTAKVCEFLKMQNKFIQRVYREKHVRYNCVLKPNIAGSMGIILHEIDKPATQTISVHDPVDNVGFIWEMFTGSRATVASDGFHVRRTELGRRCNNIQTFGGLGD